MRPAPWAHTSVPSMSKRNRRISESEPGPVNAVSNQSGRKSLSRLTISNPSHLRNLRIRTERCVMEQWGPEGKIVVRDFIRSVLDAPHRLEGGVSRVSPRKGMPALRCHRTFPLLLFHVSVDPCAHRLHCKDHRIAGARQLLPSVIRPYDRREGRRGRRGNCRRCPPGSGLPVRSTRAQQGAGRVHPWNSDHRVAEHRWE